MIPLRYSAEWIKQVIGHRSQDSGYLWGVGTKQSSEQGRRKSEGFYGGVCIPIIVDGHIQFAKIP